jgi:hypothetical protein
MSSKKETHTSQSAQSSIDDFGFYESKPKESIAMPIVAHEIGHLVGLLLNDKCVEPFGIATIINFGCQNPRFNFDWTDQIFRVLKNETEIDFYEQRGYDIIKNEACVDTMNFLDKKYNLERFPWFIVQKLIGGVFQLLHYQKSKQTKIADKHFDCIFSDVNDTDQESIAGAAGMDWTSVRMYCGAYQIPWNNLCLYRLKLFNAISDFAFYDQIEPIIQEYYTYNIDEYSGTDLVSLQEKLQSTIEGFEQLEPMLEVIKHANNALLQSIKT